MHEFESRAMTSTSSNEFEWRVLVQNRRLGDVRFIAPSLRVHISDEDRDGVWVASDEFSTVHGNGSSPDAAVDDYLACLAEQFIWENEHEDDLGAALKSELLELRQLMARDSER